MSAVLALVLTTVLVAVIHRTNEKSLRPLRARVAPAAGLS